MPKITRIIRQNDSYENRLQDFLDNDWETSSKGNPYRAYKNHLITVFRNRFCPEFYSVSIVPLSKTKGKPAYINDDFETEDDAAAAAFDRLESMGGDAHA